MFVKSRKRCFLLTFMGFGPKGNIIIQEATVCCRRMTEDAITEARNWACRMAKEAGVNVEGMCLINSLEFKNVLKSQKGGSK